MKYVIYADEAWTQSTPLYRYHCFFGGLFSTQKSFKDLEQEVRTLKKHFNYKKEIKWGNISIQDIDFYNELLICIEKFIDRNPETKYRQLFMDRVYKYTGQQCSELETQFKIYYQFLKHCFGFEHVITPTIVILKLDTHSSHLHKQRLISYLQELRFPNVQIKIEFINSRKSIALQMCDLLMGAAGYYGNKIDWDFLPNKSKRTRNQMMKAKFGKDVYNLLRRTDAKYRGSKTFGWFETTGIGGLQRNRYDHKLRIWKFVPNEHVYDETWEDGAFPKNRVRKKIP
ncbi:DUF3800 domain-containing protein [Acinetobacter lwoffii]|uniref:DUF3800 domain-containing protein n=1 Tax=Acinetobacter lwoffii TaxID=28090 RepID=UPI00168CDE3F|nr:DUF3800 domain-containing protein [Acinetobacter lwoffii]